MTKLIILVGASFLLASPALAKGFKVPAVKVPIRTSVPSVPRTTPVPRTRSDNPMIHIDGSWCGFWCGYWLGGGFRSPAKAAEVKCDPKLEKEGLCPPVKK